ncbi:helicase C-terminal domain-containing protein [Lactococcus lactis]|uniref:helicase C-terminal domain-containing protein n=1 Tax=Lactococcus lactis TaxID=1358 RepID=UPI00223A7A6E|nr:helicase C-terminal domain-containing protein [Lactococcus lactis]
MNKLPYPVPSDAYIELISQGYSDKERYEKIIAPMMLKKLEQAMGRLIRTKTDTGVITIFDKRIAPGKYPYKFIEFLGYTITSDLSEVEKFIKKITSNKISSINKAFDEQLLIIPEVPRLAKKLTKPTQSRTKNPSQSNNSGFISPRNQKAKLPNPTPSPNRNGKYKNTQPVYKPKSRTRSDLYMERNWLIKFMNEHKNDTDKQADKIVASKLNTSAAIFQNGLNFCHQKAIDYHLVFDTYPYIDDNQKHNFELKKPQSPSDFKVDWL